jgi:hypothetical protein
MAPVHSFAGMCSNNALGSHSYSNVINTRVRIQEVPSSNLGPETGYPDRFLWFHQAFHANAGIVPYNQDTTASFRILSCSSFTYHPLIQRNIAYVTEKHR